MSRRIKDPRIVQGKKNRNNSIRAYFNKRYNQGARYEIIEEEIILKWGISSSTIYMIVNEYGRYADK